MSHGNGGEPRASALLAKVALAMGAMASAATLICVGSSVWNGFAERGIRYRARGGCQVSTAAYTGSDGVTQQFRVAMPWTSPKVEPPEGIELQFMVSTEPGCATPVTCEVLYNGSVAVSQAGPLVAFCRVLNR